MKTSICFALALTVLCAPAPAQIRDMTVLKVGNEGSGDFRFFGTVGGLRAYSIATTSCNEGNVQLPWIAEEVHIAQNMFRIGEGRVEQLGYSWLKLGFCAVNEPGCGTCQSTPCSTLGIGCADTYSSGLNDGQNGHDKADVNPTLAQFTGPASNPVGDSQRGRLRVPAAEMGLPGFRYIAEAQYVYEGDHAAGNHRNNVSWREINTSSSSTAINGTGHSVRKYECAVEAWSEMQPGVTAVDVVNVDEPTRVGDAFGYYVLGYGVTSLGGGLWRYEYALQNLTSDQAAASFSLPFGCTMNLSDVFFHDVDRHSGTPWDNTDWSFSSTGELRWEVTETFAQNQDGNALRWGELFNFGFTTDAAPKLTTATIGLFKPGTTMSLTTQVKGPCATCSGSVSSYCTTSPNSVGAGSVLSTIGIPSIAANSFSLVANGAPAGQFGLFYYGAGQTSMPFGDGVRCVDTGGVGTFRINPPGVIGGTNSLTRQVDFTAPPANAGAGMIQSGSTWNFQFWYRDPLGGPSAFNLSDALAVTFCP